MLALANGHRLSSARWTCSNTIYIIMPLVSSLEHGEVHVFTNVLWQTDSGFGWQRRAYVPDQIHPLAQTHDEESLS